MVGVNYPRNWDELCRAILEQHMHQCVNCEKIGGRGTLEVHHIVPVGQGGTHSKSNLVPLCSRCHSAAHGKEMAPRVRWYTNGELSEGEFSRHKELWKQMRKRFGVPRFDPEEECVYIPVADTERILQRLPA